jgi:gluconate 2-dehydrogenase gamma chain
MSSVSLSSDILTRREAIQRTVALLGVAIAPSILAGVGRAQYAAARAGATAKPVHLTPKQFEIVAAAAERILPRTDTPGAVDVGAPAFIDLMVGEYLTAEEKGVFTAGLAEVDAAATAAHQRGFAQLTPAQQDAVLTRIAVASQAKEKTFFHALRELTLLGYFTSEQVGKNVTHYDPIPGAYRGCVPISEVGNKAWTR